MNQEEVISLVARTQESLGGSGAPGSFSSHLETARGPGLRESGWPWGVANTAPGQLERWWWKGPQIPVFWVDMVGKTGRSLARFWVVVFWETSCTPVCSGHPLIPSPPTCSPLLELITRSSSVALTMRKQKSVLKSGPRCVGVNYIPCLCNYVKMSITCNYNELIKISKKKIFKNMEN